MFEDADADGAAREPASSGVAGQRVYLDADDDAERDGGEPTQLTDAAGALCVHRLSRPQPGPCASSSPTAGAATARRTVHYDIALLLGCRGRRSDFGIHRDGTISGHLFTDRDNDGGPQEFGENDQPGRTVYVDENDDGTLDAGEPSAITGDDGDYALSSPPARTSSARCCPPAGPARRRTRASWMVTLTSREQADRQRLLLVDASRPSRA